MIKTFIKELAKIVPIEWDRFVVTEDTVDKDWDIYGWIERKDGQRDFVLLSLYLDSENGIKKIRGGFVTSSAKYSKVIYKYFHGNVKGHNNCQKITELKD